MIDDTQWQKTEWLPGRSRAVGLLKVTHMFCQVRSCTSVATHVVYWKTGLHVAGSNRCTAHAKQYAERHGVPYPNPASSE